MADAGLKPVREGQAHKRSAILTAARELFVRDGVERTSMDAVAARAGVSKRTVYDYYGDKRRLLLGVVEQAGEAALVTLRRLIDRHLPEVLADADRAATQRALISFALDLGRSQLAASDYGAAVRLITENEALLPELDDHPLETAHNSALAERLDLLSRAGLIDAPDPALAADHFHALTTLRVLNEPGRRRADLDRVDRIMTDGASAFLRAYASNADRT
ncbi:helix-turn-helix domain-containing protein [Microbacterium binotii]|uniref:HTH tetR-type domain-containing protein n=1 Tax=Microbacterium binotii TaxID=462710 RepID=A0ABN3PKM4_9MICO